MKRFIIKTLLCSLPILIPLIVFTCFISPYISGDLGKLGYITFDAQYMKEYRIKHNVINTNYQDAYLYFTDTCILTIGDSFSQTHDLGTNYTGYMSMLTHKNVINLESGWLHHNPFVRFIYLSKLYSLPKIVVIESVERAFSTRILNVNISQTPQSIVEMGLIDTTVISQPTSKRNVLENTQNWAKRIIGLKGYENPVKHAMLSKKFFSCKNNESDLFFIEDDISRINTSDSLMQSIVSKLDSLFEYAASKNIDLYILVAADKYDVYQEYIVDNPYPKNDMLEKLFALYSHPNVINSKDTLSKMLEQGCLDVYWCNDTHWSPIGSEAVAKQILQHIEK